jgi:hypothetical protein
MEILKPSSYFIFEHEIQNIRILVPLLELFKHEDFKKSCKIPDLINTQNRNKMLGMAE